MKEYQYAVYNILLRAMETTSTFVSIRLAQDFVNEQGADVRKYLRIVSFIHREYNPKDQMFLERYGFKIPHSFLYPTLHSDLTEIMTYKGVGPVAFTRLLNCGKQIRDFQIAQILKTVTPANYPAIRRALMRVYDAGLVEHWKTGLVEPGRLSPVLPKRR